MPNMILIVYYYLWKQKSFAKAAQTFPVECQIALDMLWNLIVCHLLASENHKNPQKGGAQPSTDDSLSFLNEQY